MSISNAADLAKMLGVQNGQNLSGQISAAPNRFFMWSFNFSTLNIGQSVVAGPDRNATGAAFVCDYFAGVVYLESAFGVAIAYTPLPHVGDGLIANNTLPSSNIVRVESQINNQANQNGPIRWGNMFGPPGEWMLNMHMPAIAPGANVQFKVYNDYSAAITLAGQIVMIGHYVNI